MSLLLVNISDEFLVLGAEIVRMTTGLTQSSVHPSIISQLIRSGTSAGANYEEACGAQSKADFIHKLDICFKELKETNYWLRLIEKSGILPADVISPALGKSQMLLNIIGISLVTSKRSKDEK